MMLEKSSPPWFLRLLAGGVERLRALGFPALELAPERLLSLARRATGLEDPGFGPVELTALQRLCDDAEGDAALHPVGRFAVRETLVHALVNRLLWVAAREREPRRLETPLERPLLIVGLPRSGTTALHRLLNEVLASFNSLLHTLYTFVSRRRDPGELGSLNLERLGWLCRRNLEARTRIGDQLVDVRYEELVRDPQGVVGAVHEKLGLAYEDAHARAVERFIRDRPRHHRGRHPYSLAECGLSGKDVDRVLGEYRAALV